MPNVYRTPGQAGAMSFMKAGAGAHACPNEFVLDSSGRGC
jgi:hypothetical protein